MLNKTSIFVCDIANAINMNSFAKRPIMKTRWVCITTGLHLFKCYSEESKLSRGSEQSIVKSNNVITKQFVQVIRVIHCKVTARGGKKARASLPPRSLSHSLPQVFFSPLPLYRECNRWLYDNESTHMSAACFRSYRDSAQISELTFSLHWDPLGSEEKTIYNPKYNLLYNLCKTGDSLLHLSFEAANNGMCSKDATELFLTPAVLWASKLRRSNLLILVIARTWGRCSQ